MILRDILIQHFVLKAKKSHGHLVTARVLIGYSEVFEQGKQSH